MLVFAVISFLYNTVIDPTYDWLALLCNALQVIPPVTLVPRFIINLRELYGRDLQGRRGSNIDTAFGLGSAFEQSAVRQSAIVFADGRQNESEERGDEMEMEIQEVSRTPSSSLA